MKRKTAKKARKPILNGLSRHSYPISKSYSEKNSKVNFMKKAAMIWVLTAMLGIGTYAYFSDTQLSEGNMITTGNLYLQVNGSNSLIPPLQMITGVKTDYTNYTDNITLRIIDNPGNIYLKITNVTCNQGIQTPLEIAEENGTAKDDIDTVTFYALKINGVQTLPENTYTLTSLKDKWIYLGQYPGLVNVIMQQGFRLQPNVTDWAQGDYCTFAEQVLVQQLEAPAPTPSFP